MLIKNTICECKLYDGNKKLHTVSSFLDFVSLCSRIQISSCPRGFVFPGN